MKKHILIAVLAAAFGASPAFAALKVGDTAPDFTATGSLGGKEVNFNLKTALKKGPVVGWRSSPTGSSTRPRSSGPPREFASASPRGRRRR